MLDIGKRVFTDQAAELFKIGERLGAEFEHAVTALHGTKGRVIVCGMGKSGIIARKMAATFSSTGTSAFFVHPGEAYHGDLGMFKGIDTAILISYSGETEEVIRLIPSLKHFGTPIIAIVGKVNSTLAKNADIVLNVAVEKEACPNNLAPTTSTTATLVMGDSLAVALIVKRNFQPQDFAIFHPGGSLGRRLLTRVKDLMQKHVPSVVSTDNIADVIQSISNGGVGLTIVLDPESKQMRGVITDGDLRRALMAEKNIYVIKAESIMTSAPKFIEENEMFATAEQMMVDNGITALVVKDSMGSVSGIVKLHDSKKLAI